MRQRTRLLVVSLSIAVVPFFATAANAGVRWG